MISDFVFAANPLNNFSFLAFSHPRLVKTGHVPRRESPWVVRTILFGTEVVAAKE